MWDSNFCGDFDCCWNSRLKKFEAGKLDSDWFCDEFGIKFGMQMRLQVCCTLKILGFKFYGGLWFQFDRVSGAVVVIFG